MRYYYEKPKEYTAKYGKSYICKHPVYNICTLYKIADKGLAVIQQRYNPNNKTTWWTEIDPWLIDAIYLQEGFVKFFKEKARSCTDGLYPTVTVRHLMWCLRMKPLKKQQWETVFDRADI